ncbi:MAG: TRAP transporter substrate-binding protein [Gemmatimonadetes bacterium]|nr:TRAP transporter substrate-binding protein [Gemmatimonadota bacterium]
MPATRPCVSLGLLLALGACACRGGSHAQRPELRFGHVGAPGSLFALSAEEFARRANERLGGQARIVVFGSSQLGSDDVMMQKLKLGTLELSLPSTIMSSLVDRFGLFELPYLVQDREHMRRIEERVVWPTLAPLAERQGYKILAVWENGFRHITNNKRPITTPADLRGIKLRTPAGRWRVRLFQAYGANPSPMALSEVFVALQTGVMDGQENPLAQIHTSRFQEVQRYLSLTGHVYTPAFVAMGLNTWNRLPESVRTVLEQTAREVQPFVYETAERMDRELLGVFQTSGIQVNNADREAFARASRAIYDEFAAAVTGGKDLIALAASLRRP